MASDARPAQPRSILRGHKAQIHTSAFIRHNERLMTGDADGFVVAWDLTIMRPRAVWRAHTNAILGLAGWGVDKVITHGRDNKLIVWKLALEDEARMSTTLPLDPSTESRPQPWIVYMLEVNTMNFCSFSFCPVSQGTEGEDGEILIAVPNTLASEAIDIYHLPSQARHYTVKLGDKNGMVMALSISTSGPNITLIAGYENGLAIVAQYTPRTAEWIVKYQAKPHSQPILSLDISPDKSSFITSSADSIIAKHPLPAPEEPERGDTPEPESKDSTTPQQPVPINQPKITEPKQTTSLLSAALQNESQPTPNPTLRTTTSTQVQTDPLKVINTKHSGQQSLRIRSDGRIFATAGWDNKVRVYSTKTLKEVAVLKWHKAGCYAVAFAEFEAPEGTSQVGSESSPSTTPSNRQDDQDSHQGAGSLVARPMLVELSVRDKRIKEARSAHWLAAGSKDSKVSLWDVF